MASIPQLDTRAGSQSPPTACLGVYVGGTFADFLLCEDGRLAVYKRPSPPEDPSLAVPAGLDGIVGPQELPDGGDDGDLPLRAHVLPRFGQNTP